MSDAVDSAKPIEEVDAAEFKRIQNFAIRLATRKNRSYLADDFASYVFEYLVKKGKLVYNLNWLWVDFLRDEVASTRSKKGRAKAEGIARVVPVDKAMFVADTKNPLPDDEISSRQMFRNFHMQTRVISVLSVKWGFTYDEIAEVLGVTQARIGQLVKKMRTEGLDGSLRD